MKKCAIFLCAMMVSASLFACGGEDPAGTISDGSKALCTSIVRAFERCFDQPLMSLDTCEQEYNIDNDVDLTSEDRIALENCSDEVGRLLTCEAQWYDSISKDKCDIFMTDDFEYEMERVCDRELTAVEACSRKYYK